MQGIPRKCVRIVSLSWFWKQKVKIFVVIRGTHFSGMFVHVQTGRITCGGWAIFWTEFSDSSLVARNATIYANQTAPIKSAAFVYRKKRKKQSECRLMVLTDTWNFTNDVKTLHREYGETGILLLYFDRVVNALGALEKDFCELFPPSPSFSSFSSSCTFSR